MASDLIDKDMYRGKLHVTHNPDAKGSQPRYVVTNNETGEITKPSGVTTILSAVLAKDLVGWALDCFETALLAKMTGHILDDEPLSVSDIAEAKLASEHKRDGGAASGSLVHRLVEQYLEGKPDIDFSELTVETALAYEAFVKWFEAVKPEVIGVEGVVYSQMYKYAGCYDSILKIDGLTYLCDLKTTNASRKALKGIYPEMFIQLGAYAGALMEEDPSLKIDGLMVISAKKNGKLDLATRTDVAWCAQMFRNVLAIKEFLTQASNKIEEG